MGRKIIKKPFRKWVMVRRSIRGNYTSPGLMEVEF
jgi:hypothetical protein